MNQRNAVVAAVFMFAIVLASVGISAKQSDTRVIYDCNGNALIAYGGAKDQLPVPSSSTSCSFEREASSTRSTTVSYHFGAWKGKSYGDGAVITSFSSDADVVLDWFLDSCEVSGNCITYWTGDDPQTLSSEIELSISWKFTSIITNVEAPSGAVGYSTSSNTVYWSGDVGSGHWALGAVYEGVYAEGSWLVSVTQTSTGSHFFEEAIVPTWVIVSASKRQSFYQ